MDKIRADFQDGNGGKLSVYVNEWGGIDIENRHNFYNKICLSADDVALLVQALQYVECKLKEKGAK